MKRPSLILICVLILASCSQKAEYYSYTDFRSVPKTDVHLHINSTIPAYLQLAVDNNFRIISPNVDSEIPVSVQLDTASAIAGKWPGRFYFLGTFSVDRYGQADFADSIIGTIKKCMSRGASGIKIWKNIGMVLRDTAGKYIMIDDPAFEPVFRYLQENRIPVMGHLGEPKNCWLPLNEMTDTSNYRYYKSHPEYYMYIHPEAPSYEDQMNARDNVLGKYPDLAFEGAHFASLEWSVDELAERLDSFPNLSVDMSARMGHLQYQSIADYEKVKSFLLKYQDRIMYGTDITVGMNEKNPQARTGQIHERWISNWVYLATDSTQQIKNLPGEVRGMHLPKTVIDKIYNTNAEKFFRLK